MRTVDYSGAFRRDLKKALRQGKDANQLHAVVELLRGDAPLPVRNGDHPLKGKWRGRRELHIAPDWLLIYHIENDTVYLDRAGSHADLFG